MKVTAKFIRELELNKETVLNISEFKETHRIIFRLRKQGYGFFIRSKKKTGLIKVIKTEQPKN